MKYVGNSLRGDIDIILSSIVQNRTFENADKNVMQYVDEKLKSTPEFQKQVADFKNQLEEEQEFMSNITNNIFKLNSTDSNKAYDDFKKQKEKGKDFIETKIKEGIPYAEARKQWLHTLDPFKQKIEEFTLSKSEKKKSDLQQKEAELSELEAEEKTIDEAEALIDTQNQKESQDLGE